MVAFVYSVNSSACKVVVLRQSACKVVVLRQSACKVVVLRQSACKVVVLRHSACKMVVLRQSACKTVHLGYIVYSMELRDIHHCIAYVCTSVPIVHMYYMHNMWVLYTTLFFLAS